MFPGLFKLSTIAIAHRQRLIFRARHSCPEPKVRPDIQARGGRIAIKAEFDHLEPASGFGSAYLTYVLWAISPEGNPNNLGELILDASKRQAPGHHESSDFRHDRHC